jgi:hypothetical protein
MKKILLFTISLFCLMASAQKAKIRGDRNVVTDDRSFGYFTKLEVNNKIKLTLKQSKSTKLVIEADENLHELITTEVRDGTLHITATKNIWGASAKKIHLSADFINEIKVSSGAEVYSENTFSSDKLVINASSGAHANMDLNVDDLRCEGSSGSEMKLSGEAVEFTVSTSSGSNIDAYRLSARSCNANATSGSNVRLRVTETFVGKATSGAGIKYKGHPKRVDKSDNSGASISSVKG